MGWVSFCPPHQKKGTPEPARYNKPKSVQTCGESVFFPLHKQLARRDEHACFSYPPLLPKGEVAFSSTTSFTYNNRQLDLQGSTMPGGRLTFCLCIVLSPRRQGTSECGSQVGVTMGRKEMLEGCSRSSSFNSKQQQQQKLATKNQKRARQNCLPEQKTESA